MFVTAPTGAFKSGWPGCPPHSSTTNLAYDRYPVKNYLLILPIAILVTYSQIVVKWRSLTADQPAPSGFPEHLVHFVTDPVVLSAYLAALFASFAWLFVITKLPLTVAFPVYIGLTFAMVIFGGWFFLSETLSTTRVLAVFLIFGGIVLGVASDA